MAVAGSSNGQEGTAQPVEFQVGAFQFERPYGWSWVPATSPLRKAHLSVQGPGGELADVVFFHFGPGQGGSVQANVERWLQQVESATEQSVREEQVGKTKITFVEAEGTFLSGMPGTPSVPMPGFMLRGAILESAEGDVYVKFTGPSAAVKPATEEFEKMVRAAAASSP